MANMQPNPQAIRHHRLAAGLTQAELAAKSGVSRATVGFVENGKGAHPRTVKKLADALGLTVADLAQLPELEPQAS